MGMMEMTEGSDRQPAQPEARRAPVLVALVVFLACWQVMRESV